MYKRGYKSYASSKKASPQSMTQRSYSGYNRYAKKAAGPRKKFTAYGDLAIPGFGDVGFGYDSSQKRAAKTLNKGQNYFAPSSGVATTMKTSNNPIMTASKKGAVCITQREILTTVSNTSGEGAGVFNLDVLDVNPGLSTICSWGSQIAKAFQEYKMKFRLVYTASCPSDTSGQLLIAFDHNVGNPTVPQDKQQMSNFSGCVSSQLWAPMTSNYVYSKKLYIRDGPVPSGQSAQLYDFTKILIATADVDGGAGNITFGTLYIEYEMELYMPRLQYSDESILFSQNESWTNTQTKAEIEALDFYTPQTALVGYAGAVADLPPKKLPLNVSGNLEVYCLVDAVGEFQIVFPGTGYYELTMGCLSTNGITGAPYVSWPDVSQWDFGDGIGGAWSIVNPNNDSAVPGTLLINGGGYSDNVVYTQQNIIVLVNEVGTYIDSAYNVNGESWMACMPDICFTDGVTRTSDNRVDGSFIIVNPVGQEVITYFDPSFAPLPASLITGYEHLARRPIKHVRTSKKKINKPAKAASSVPVVEEERDLKHFADSIKEDTDENRRFKKAMLEWLENQ